MLEKAFKKVSSLNDQEQDAFASFILEELDSEAKWHDLFAGSQDGLSKLAAQAIAEDERGETEELSIESDFPQD